jgi:uncharacterized protein (DUF305 family)
VNDEPPRRADISDPRVRKLADEIIAVQEREIAESSTLVSSATTAQKRRDRISRWRAPW